MGVLIAVLHCGSYVLHAKTSHAAENHPKNHTHLAFEMDTFRPRLSFMAVATYHSAMDTTVGTDIAAAAWSEAWSLGMLHASMTSRTTAEALNPMCGAIW